MKALTFVLSMLAVALSACILVPPPIRAAMPLTIGAAEYAHWLVVFNMAVIVLAWRFMRRASFPAMAALCIAVWPYSEATRLRHSPWLYRRISVPDIAPKQLPMNILFYPSRASGGLLGTSERKPAIALIDIYGGAWQRGAPSSDRAFDSYMASRGFPVFAIDYRHAPGWHWPTQLEDVRAAIRFIRENAGTYGLDADQLVLCGRSAGGQLALVAAYEEGAAPFRGVVAFYPPSDLARGYQWLPSPDPIDVRSLLAAYLGGPPSQVPAAYRAASAISYADRKGPPTLLIQGGRDHVVRPEFARALYTKLRAAGNQAKLLEIPWAEHSFDEAFSGLGSQVTLTYVEDFLRGL